jgi:hypothetical protein
MVALFIFLTFPLYITGCSYADDKDDSAEFEFNEPNNGVSLTSIDRKKKLKYIPGYKCTWNATYDEETLVRLTFYI